MDYNESEAKFSRFFGRGTGIHNSLLIAYNKLPALDSPKLQVVIEVCLALEVQLSLKSIELGQEEGMIFYI